LKEGSTAKVTDLVLEDEQYQDAIAAVQKINFSLIRQMQESFEKTLMSTDKETKIEDPTELFRAMISCAGFLGGEQPRKIYTQQEIEDKNKAKELKDKKIKSDKKEKDKDKDKDKPDVKSGTGWAKGSERTTWNIKKFNKN
jgi:hypothetical protein